MTVGTSFSSSLSRTSNLSASLSNSLTSCLLLSSGLSFTDSFFHQQRRWKVGGSNEFFYGGARESATNNRLLKLPETEEEKMKQKEEEQNRKYEFTKFPSAIKKLGAEYFFRAGQHHEQQTYYHMKTHPRPLVCPITKEPVLDPKTKEQVVGSNVDMCFVGTTLEGRRITRTIENSLYEHTRGFAIQIIMEGRGCKIYFQPKYPKLMARVGVGCKGKNLEKYCKLDKEVKIEVNKVGSLCVVSGPTKSQVGSVAFRLFWKIKQNVYTGKGAKIAFNWVKRKTVKKK